MMESTSTPVPPSDPLGFIKDQFRHHLDIFYAKLKLAPPYESVEKAVRNLTSTLQTLPQGEQARIASDPLLCWKQFRLAFESSGLNQKHRGIIAGLARNRAALNLPSEYDEFLKLFTG